MANTYTQIHIQAIFAVQDRESLINKIWRERLYRYINAIIQRQKHKVIAIGGTANHVHILIGQHKGQTISDLMREIKRGSSEWINHNKFVKGTFRWQSGYGAFSYSKDNIAGVAKYIEKQEEHHKKYTFTEEYKQILGEFDVEYNEQYIFHEIDRFDGTE